MWTLPAFWGASGFVPWSMRLLVSTSTETSKQHHFIMGGGQLLPKKLFPMKGRDEADGGNSPGGLRLVVKEAKDS